MNAEDVVKIIRSCQRPWLVLLFTSIVAVIGILAVIRLLPPSIDFIDRDIALIIITAVVMFMTAIISATTAIVAYLFGERASKKPEEK